ncbi:serine/threonine-protein phosphatase [Paeniglutamicibacter gangotriensis]|uniref:Serine/threonine-protein phosphatase n=1 Tax=Paeniglutamicibacter gangotriensis TaxID=254787 RepID=A0A5B0ENX3_9MICC|nr:PP2C family serine/threonine-protein phosphatase [Paeniglutamicibacter gangotriensis]KAA0979440.1 serine/threonine-protein phosphatase [Paeniglutamicibacter gangotriensis]
MALMLKFAARSDVGKVRSKNDDSAYVGRYLAVVADGMGGHVGGDVASASTVLDLVHLDVPDTVDPETVLPDEIQAANLVLNDLVSANPKLSGMGTTVTALLLTENVLQFAHIGDSRAYRLKNGVFEQVSHDHTFVQRLVDEGRIQPEEAELHPHKNVLLRVLGDSDASPELDVDQYPVEAGERWMLCSDGLNAVVPDSITERIMRGTASLEETVEDLVETTLAHGSPDNVTIVVFELVEDHGFADPVYIEAPAADEPAPDTGQLTIAVEGDLDASAALIRHEMSKRPHLLVGAAELATQSGKIPIVTQRSGEKRAAAILTHKTPAAQAAQEQEEHESYDRRPRRWLVTTFLALMTLILVAVLGWGYLWTQTQYFVGNHEGQVAIFKGVSQDLGPLKLSHLDTVTDIPVEALPEYTQQRIDSSLPAKDLAHAQSMVGELLVTAKQRCPVVVPENPGAAGNLPVLPPYCQEIAP